MKICIPIAIIGLLLLSIQAFAKTGFKEIDDNTVPKQLTNSPDNRSLSDPKRSSIYPAQPPPAKTGWEHVSDEDLIRGCMDKPPEYRMLCHEEYRRRAPRRSKEAKEKAYKQLLRNPPANVAECTDMANMNGTDAESRQWIAKSCGEFLAYYENCVDHVSKTLGLVATNQRILQCYRQQPIDGPKPNEQGHRQPKAGNTNIDLPVQGNSSSKKRYLEMLSDAEEQLRRLQEVHDAEQLRLSRELQALTDRRLREQQVRDEIAEKLERFEHERNYGSQVDLDVLEREILALRQQHEIQNRELERVERERRALLVRQNNVQHQYESQRSNISDVLQQALGIGLQIYNTNNQINSIRNTYRRPGTGSAPANNSTGRSPSRNTRSVSPPSVYTGRDDTARSR